MSKYNHLNMLLAVTLAAVCLACGVASAAAAPPYQKVYYDLNDADNLYRKYIEKHNKQYTAEEYGKRLEIFKETLKDINVHNALYPKTVFGPTVLSDMTPEEKNARGCAFYNNSTQAVQLKLTPGMIYEDSYDWRDQGAVTPVKDQDYPANCGSCYIFSAIGSIEGQYARKYQECLAFSEQQALDCVPNKGCGGGNPEDLINGLAADTAGLMLGTDYPYTAVKGQCAEDASKKRATVLSGQRLSISDEETLKKSLVEYGPLSIIINSSALAKYNGGVLTPTSCDGTLHAVLLVGYGDEAGTPYWIIKNSWGQQFGEQGYLRLRRGVGACNLLQYVTTSQVG